MAHPVYEAVGRSTVRGDLNMPQTVSTAVDTHRAF
jgi:hypothetical protein